MLLLVQLVTAAVVPAKVTVLVPWAAPKFVPVSVIEVPTGPVAGNKPVIPGLIVKIRLLLARLPTATTTGAFPKPRPDGMETATLVLLQLTIGAGAPPTLTLLVP